MAVAQETLDGLNKGIEAELAAYVFYKKGLKISRDQKLQEALTKLAGEEKEHYKILEGQYDSLVRSEKWVTYNDILRRPGLPDLDEKIAEVHSRLIDEITPSTPPMRVLEIGLMLEEQARDLYAGLAQKTSDHNGRATYEYLVKFENSHISKIKNIMKDFA